MQPTERWLDINGIRVHLLDWAGDAAHTILYFPIYSGLTHETDDFAGGQLTRDSVAADLPRLDFDRIYPLAGPLHVQGPEPADPPAGPPLDFALPHWAWACVLPRLRRRPPGACATPRRCAW